jgi:Transposase
LRAQGSANTSSPTDIGAGAGVTAPNSKKRLGESLSLKSLVRHRGYNWPPRGSPRPDCFPIGHSPDRRQGRTPRRRSLWSIWPLHKSSLPSCLVGLEAGGSAHHWARELIKLGHEARMMPPAYVKPYIRRQKNDASDAAAICEAVTRPTMRFVGVRSLENQAALMRHKTREVLVSQRTQLLNALRGHLTEVGVARRLEMAKSDDFRRIVDRAVELARRANGAFGSRPPGSHS